MDFIEVFLELLGKCLGIVLDLRKPNFACIFTYKGWELTPEIEIFRLKFAPFDGFE